MSVLALVTGDADLDEFVDKVLLPDEKLNADELGMLVLVDFSMVLVNSSAEDDEKSSVAVDIIDILVDTFDVTAFFSVVTEVSI